MGKKPAYSVRMVVASMNGQQHIADRIACECIEDMSGSLNGLLGQYHPADLPMFIVAMRLLDKALDPLLNDSARNLVKNMTDRTTCITVDAEEFRRQAKEQQHGDEKP